MSIQPLGFVDTSTFTAMFVVKHRDRAENGILQLRDFKDDEGEPSDLAILREWKSARALLSRLRAAAAPFFDGRTPELGRAWIEVLPPGSGAPWHADAGDYPSQVVRTRTCLIPCPGAVSYSGLASAVLAVGMVNLVDHQLMCSEVNHGEHARTHLVVDFYAPTGDAEA